MFDRRWTSPDAELSIHRMDDAAQQLSIVRLFTIVLMSSLLWTLIGLVLYCAAIFDVGEIHCTFNTTTDAKNDACDAWLWQYSIARAFIVTLSVVALCFCQNDRPKWRAAYIALPMLLIPFAWASEDFLADEMNCCANAVYDATPIVCVLCCIFVCIDASGLLAGATFAAAMAMTSIRDFT